MSDRVLSQILSSKTIEGTRILLVRFKQDAATTYALGVIYNSIGATPQSYAGTRDIISTYRAYLLLGNFLTRDPGPIRRRMVKDYAEDCRWIVDPTRPKQLDAGRDAPVSVSAVRDRLGLEAFLRLRDFPVNKMPPAILRMANGG